MSILGYYNTAIRIILTDFKLSSFHKQRWRAHKSRVYFKVSELCLCWRELRRVHCIELSRRNDPQVGNSTLPTGQTSLLLLQTTTGPRTMATLLLCCICHFILTLLSGYLSKVDCSRQWWSYTSFMFENRHRVWNTMCLLLRRRLCAQRSKVHHMSGWPVMEWVSIVVLCQR